MHTACARLFILDLCVPCHITETKFNTHNTRMHVSCFARCILQAIMPQYTYNAILLAAVISSNCTILHAHILIRRALSLFLFPSLTHSPPLHLALSLPLSLIHKLVIVVAVGNFFFSVFLIISVVLQLLTWQTRDEIQSTGFLVSPAAYHVKKNAFAR